MRSPSEAEDLERIFPILETLAPDGKTSMLQDVEAPREVVRSGERR